MKKVITEDGSVTFFNDSVGDHYHSKSGAREEAEIKHADSAGISGKEDVIIFDICFGLGYNSAAALDIVKSATIHCYENDRNILKEIRHIKPGFRSYDIIQEFVRGFLENGEPEYSKDGNKLIMHFGDAKDEIKNTIAKADAVFFDPFSPAKQPWMWTKRFLDDIRVKMKPGKRLTTYSYARKVRENFRSAGFKVIDGPILGRRSPSIIAINPLDM